ncbi:hypothetical protein O181_026854 [Austropuccinia psidii MF-1]|uniref:Uncharacterized protein n=1 Tax=Austropuccinia psidii MF-1 TaxID=1389203 RepID=A0A9Q3CKR9_9BASI|nr:hypothetical protein [Austropuccinia psidii MF-1]
MLVMLADKHTRTACLLSAPSNHTARGVLAQDTLVRTPLLSTMMKPYLSVNGHRDPKQVNGDDSGRLALSNPPPRPLAMARGHSSLGQLSPMGFKFQNSPVPSLPCEQTPQQPTPGRSGTQWSEELFCKPSQTKEPPIPGLSPCSQPPEDILTHEPEPEVAPMQSTEEPFACPATPSLIIIIDYTPVGSHPPPPPSSSLTANFPSCSPPSTPTPVPSPVQSPSHSHDDACQEFTNLRPTLMIPQAIIHESINQILLEHRCLLYMIPFVDATHRNEMHWDFREELNFLLAEALDAYPKEDITGIVSFVILSFKKIICIQ